MAKPVRLLLKPAEAELLEDILHFVDTHGIVAEGVILRMRQAGSDHAADFVSLSEKLGDAIVAYSIRSAA